MNNPPLIPQAFATSGSKNTIQDTRQAGQDEEDATWSSGFPNVTMQPSESGGLPPKGMDFNGIFNAISSPIVHLQKGGAYKFDSDYAAKIGGYSIGSVLQSNDGKSSYVSLINNNTTDFNSNPDSIGTDWAPWAGESIKPDSGTPIGAIEYFGTSAAPAGYLIANGAAVGRTTYPDLFAAIGTAFGEGDGSTTFNLPDLIDRFAQGSDTPGQKLEAGLPNISGTLPSVKLGVFLGSASGAFNSQSGDSSELLASGGSGKRVNTDFVASRSNPIYGASETVQPPALTLLPCIKAFDAAINPGLIDITELANEVATHKHVTETYNDGTNWYRKWSDGWLEQGGHVSNDGTGLMSVSLLIPFSSANYCISITSERSAQSTTQVEIKELGYHSKTAVGFKKYLSVNKTYEVGFGWYACGQGAQS
ncbi:tail fiber protein [Oxalobacter formigenes]|uniref:phage tail protein n=1 Tax=Oxalobacter formigenes TaxID=847 RepID=UPI0022B00596|nr:phage tail protein [Oxalobacter formigenes]WAW01154.1 tail fiber protein [Oxalobacter formigenes]WAW03482.1 tail fiber protein [Oxalobacter formigenes]